MRHDGVLMNTVNIRRFVFGGKFEVAFTSVAELILSEVGENRWKCFWEHFSFHVSLMLVGEKGSPEVN